VAGTITEWDTGRGERHEMLESLLPFFGGKCITTNIAEGTFSSTKYLMEFRGRREVESWKESLHAFFAMRWNPSILDDALVSLELNSQTNDRMLKALNLSIGKQVVRGAA